jgi:glucuronate isomerase
MRALFRAQMLTEMAAHERSTTAWCMQIHPGLLPQPQSPRMLGEVRPRLGVSTSRTRTDYVGALKPLLDRRGHRAAT